MDVTRSGQFRYLVVLRFASKTLEKCTGGRNCCIDKPFLFAFHLVYDENVENLMFLGSI